MQSCVQPSSYLNFWQFNLAKIYPVTNCHTAMYASTASFKQVFGQFWPSFVFKPTLYFYNSCIQMKKNYRESYQMIFFQTHIQSHCAQITALWKGAPSFTLLICSAELGFPTLASLHSLCSHTRSLTLLTPSWDCWKSYVFTLKTRSKGTNAFLVITRNAIPYVAVSFGQCHVTS